MAELGLHWDQFVLSFFLESKTSDRSVLSRLPHLYYSYVSGDLMAISDFEKSGQRSVRKAEEEAHSLH